MRALATFAVAFLGPLAGMVLVLAITSAFTRDRRDDEDRKARVLELVNAWYERID